MAEPTELFNLYLNVSKFNPKCDTNKKTPTKPDKTKTYLKYVESNVETFDQASVSFVGHLHERHQKVFFPLALWTLTE